MNINWQLIGDLTIVNNLIKFIQHDRRTYQVRMDAASLRSESSEDSNSENAAEMVDVQNQLDASTNRIGTLVPDSKSYLQESIKLNKLTARKTQLILDSETVGDEALALRVYNLQKTKVLLDLAIAEEANGIARRTALGG